MTWKLKRTAQCAKCPWKVAVNPHDIPDGYSEEAHAALADTIAKPDAPLDLTAPLRVMACHETVVGDETHCVGWLAHQLGRGNNIMLRLAMHNCENVHKIRTIGPQHQTFEDTLP